MRFKTEKEFEKEFGEDWRIKISPPWNRSGKMDYLFGLPWIKGRGESDCYPEKTNDKYHWSIGDQMLTDKPLHNMKYSIGQTVKFTKCGSIPKYYCDPEIPRGKIKHGSSIFKENRGVIVEIHESYYLVEYIDNEGNNVRLGFLEDVLLPLEGEIKPTLYCYITPRHVDDFYDGQEFVADLGSFGKDIKGKVHVKQKAIGKFIYLCQNVRDGGRGDTTHGFKCSWCVLTDGQEFFYDGKESVRNLMVAPKPYVEFKDVSDKYDGFITPKSFDDLHDGQDCNGLYRGSKFNGRVRFEGNTVYLCQDLINGADCKDKFGYKYSYFIGTAGGPIGSNVGEVRDFKVNPVLFPDSAFTTTVYIHKGNTTSSAVGISIKENKKAHVSTPVSGSEKLTIKTHTIYGKAIKVPRFNISIRRGEQKGRARICS
jgi:hypothetical protein